MIAEPKKKSLIRWYKLAKKPYSLLRSLEYEAVEGLYLKGKVLDIGGGATSDYHQLLNVKGSIESVNIDKNRNPADDFFETLKRLQRMEDSSSRTFNDLDILMDTLEKIIPDINTKLNESLTKQSENEESAKIWNDIYWIMGFFVIIYSFIWISFRLYNKKRFRQSVLEGQFEYKS